MLVVHVQTGLPLSIYCKEEVTSLQAVISLGLLYQSTISNIHRFGKTASDRMKSGFTALSRKPFVCDYTPAPRQAPRRLATKHTISKQTTLSSPHERGAPSGYLAQEQDCICKVQDGRQGASQLPIAGRIGERRERAGSRYAMISGMILRIMTS